MWVDLFKALSLVLVIEGLLPFISPQRWRHFISSVVSQNDKALRIYGLVSMLMGTGLLYLIR